MLPRRGPGEWRSEPRRHCFPRLVSSSGCWWVGVEERGAGPARLPPPHPAGGWGGHTFEQDMVFAVNTA